MPPLPRGLVEDALACLRQGDPAAAQRWVEQALEAQEGPTRAELEETAGPIGVQLAVMFVEKATDTIGGFPDAGPVEWAAIARLAAGGLTDYADELEKAAAR